MLRKIHKRILFSLLFLSLIFVTGGCVKFNTEITIDRNGNAEIVDIVKVNDEVLNIIDANPQNKVDDINAKKDSNIKAEVIEDNGYTGTKVTCKVRDVSKNDIKNESLLSLSYHKTKHESGKLIDVKKSIFTTTYDIDSIVDFSYDQETGKRDTTMLSAINSQLKIKIPVKAKKHNATSVDEKELVYTWRYNTDTPENPVTLTYTVLNILNISIAVILLAILLFSILFVIKRSNNNSKQCPKCGKKIKINAQKCRFCGEWLNEKEGDNQ